MNKITVKILVQKDIDSAWEIWTNPEHIQKWNHATDEWNCPRATNDLQPGGKFSFRMEAKDGSMGFDFSGTYDAVDQLKKITFSLDDGRKTEIQFIKNGSSTEIVEIFDAEKSNPTEMQQQGWQSILNNFKKYAESI